MITCKGSKLNTEKIFEFVRPYVLCSVPPISQRWLSQEIAASPSAVGRYLECGKGLGPEKVEAMLDVLGLVIDGWGTLVPETETALVLSEGTESEALFRTITRIPQTKTPVYSEDGTRVGIALLLPETASGLIFLGREVHQSSESLLGKEHDLQTEKEECVVIPDKLARKWRGGRAHYHQVLRLSEGDPLAHTRDLEYVWKLIDEIRFPLLTPEARLLTELHVNEVHPSAALEIVRRDLGAKKVA